MYILSHTNPWQHVLRKFHLCDLWKVWDCNSWLYSQEGMPFVDNLSDLNRPSGWKIASRQQQQIIFA